MYPSVQQVNAVNVNAHVSQVVMETPGKTQPAQVT